LEKFLKKTGQKSNLQNGAGRVLCLRETQLGGQRRPVQVQPWTTTWGGGRGKKKSLSSKIGPSQKVEEKSLLIKVGFVVGRDCKEEATIGGGEGGATIYPESKSKGKEKM